MKGRVVVALAVRAKIAQRQFEGDVDERLVKAVEHLKTVATLFKIVHGSPSESNALIEHLRQAEAAPPGTTSNRLRVRNRHSFQTRRTRSSWPCASRSCRSRCNGCGRTRCVPTAPDDAAPAPW